LILASCFILCHKLL